MSYQVIALKYRPQHFDDVVGQEHVTTTLANAIEQKRIAHAYLFCGPRGTGKTTIARIFAKALNSTGGPKVNFDDKDPRCQEIAEGRALDVLEIDGASNNGVEQVRELRETCKYVPAQSRFKIYIIDEVHMLSTQAFNALLKTLEEPPEHVKFMFATTEPEKVLPTILSRCQRFDLRRIPAALIVKHLTHIAKLEKVKVEQAALYAIARGAEGGMRDAESTLDQLISFCGEKIEEADVLSMFGLAAQGQLLALSRAILDGDVEGGLRQLNELANGGKDLGRLLGDLLNHFRNLLVFQVARGDTAMLEVSEEEAAALAEQAKLAIPESAGRILEVLGDADYRLRDAASKKILLEITLLKAIEARNAVSLDSVLKRLQELRGSCAGPTPGAPASLPAGSASTAPAATKRSRSESATSPRAHMEAAPGSASVPAGEVIPPIASASTPSELREQISPAETAGSTDLTGLWTKVVEAVGRVSQFTRSYLLEAHPVSFNKNLLTIGFDPEFEEHLGLVDNPRNHTLLQTKLTELGHPNAQIKFIKAPAPSAAPEVAPQPAPAPQAAAPATPKQAAPAEKTGPLSLSPEDFKNDPLIQRALEMFRGQIVQVRA